MFLKNGENFGHAIDGVLPHLGARAVAGDTFGGQKPPGNAFVRLDNAQVGRLGEVTARLSATAAEIARRFAAHPAVARVRTADTGPTAAAFRALRRPGAGAGALITIELRGEMRRVYDRLRVVKGPSFGLRYTLTTPFLWLAHFDQVTTEAGRAEIRAAGLDPDLLRVSVGVEPPEEIWAAFSEALG
jgi:cystathionine gamma-synthase